MKALSRLKTTVSIIEGSIDRIRVYRRLALYTDYMAMPAARRRLGWDDL